MPPCFCADAVSAKAIANSTPLTAANIRNARIIQPTFPVGHHRDRAGQADTGKAANARFATELICVPRHGGNPLTPSLSPQARESQRLLLLHDPDPVPCFVGERFIYPSRLRSTFGPDQVKCKMHGRQLLPIVKKRDNPSRLSILFRRTRHP